MKRREAIQLFTAAAAATLASGRTFGQNDKTSQKLRVLIFGGTGFLGPHFVRALQAGGHQVTLFNRGKSNPGLFKDLETLIGDRDGKLDALKGRDWDVVIDAAAYVPRQVKLSAALARRGRQGCRAAGREGRRSHQRDLCRTQSRLRTAKKG